MKLQTLEGRAARLGRMLEGRRKLLVLSHTNPDPDGLGSAVGLRHLAQEKFDLPSTFGLCGRVMRAENRAMVDCLGLELTPIDELELDEFDCIAVVDTQPGFGHTKLPNGRAIDLVIDHHVALPDAPPAADSSIVDVRTDIGATSSIVTDYLMQFDCELPASVATALFYGLLTDTLDLSRNASRLDTRAYDWLSTRIDRKKLAQITRPSLPLGYYRALRDALENVRIYDDLVLCSLGETHSPEMVAEVADLLLRMDGCQAAFCGGLVGDTYYVSVRTELDGKDAYTLIHDGLGGEGSFGGHGAVAGGCIVLPDPCSRSVKRLERRLERNILRSMGRESATPSGLGD